MQAQIFDALRRGADDDALTLARAAVEAEPQSARARLWLAMALKAGGQQEAAIAALDHGIALAPEDADLHVHRASLLLGRRELGAAQSALEQALALDPNQFPAYILQANLALAEGRLDEAERLSRLAARVAPDHPWGLALEAMIALQRGDADAALALATRALDAAGDDPRVLLAAGLAYRQKGHLAFAEQAFRSLLEGTGGSDGVRLMLVQVLQVQRRPDEALEALQPLLQDATPAPLLRLAGELALQAGRADDAKGWLRRALLEAPGDERALAASMQAWRQSGDAEDARRTLDEALSRGTSSARLWQARLSLESERAQADAVVDRWNAAMPDHVAALEARMQQQRGRDEADAAVATARRIIDMAPGNALAHGVVVEALNAEDPAAAVAYVEALLPQARTEASREWLLGLLGDLEDAAGLHQAALARWIALAEARKPRQLPLPPVSLSPDTVPAGPWPAWDAGAADADRTLQTLFLWGPPGSCVENVAAVLSAFAGFRGDRMSPDAPGDGFQRFASIERLSSGAISGADVAGEWRAALPARGVEGEHVIEWLVWWDNALLRVLRPHVADAGVVFVLRDPRDMLLQWLARGSPMQFSVPSPQLAAEWLATVLSQVVETAATPLFRSTVLKLDGIEGDAGAIGERLAQALGVPAPETRPLARRPLPAGHWRQYAEVLAEPFAALTPVAKVLGYPED